MQIEKNEICTNEYKTFGANICKALSNNESVYAANIVAIDKSWKIDNISADVRLFLHVEYTHPELHKERVAVLDLQYIYLDYKKGLSFDACVEKASYAADVLYKQDINIVNEMHQQELE